MFVFKTSLRYAFSRKSGHRSSSILIIIGIALGTMAVLVVGAVMDGLQSRQIDQYRNVSSFDLIVDTVLNKEQLLSIEGVEEAWRFKDMTVLVQSDQAMKLRAIDPSYYGSVRFQNSCSVRPCNDTMSILVSYRTQTYAGIRVGGTFDLTFFLSGKVSKLRPMTVEATAGGSFSSSISAFNEAYLFASYDWVESVYGELDGSYGIYMSGRQRTVMEDILELDPEAKITTWQESNNTLYSALVLEKVLMDVFLSSVLIVLCVSLRNSSKRLVLRKLREAAMMRAMGCTGKLVELIFIEQAVLVSVIGAGLGIAISFPILDNLAIIFDILGFITGGNSTYLMVSTQFPVFETIMLAVAVPLAAVLFTYRGVGSALKKDVMEVLLHESC